MEIILGDNSDDSVSKAYELVNIAVGTEFILARPVEWDRTIETSDGKDLNGEYAIPIKYEATCPWCGYMVSFDNNHEEVMCDNCNVGENVLKINNFPDVFCDPGKFSISESKNDNDDIDMVDDKMAINTINKGNINKNNFDDVGDDGITLVDVGDEHTEYIERLSDNNDPVAELRNYLDDNDNHNHDEYSDDEFDKLIDMIQDDNEE